MYVPNFQRYLLRSHFGSIALGFHSVEPRDEDHPVLAGPSWSTPFDGGMGQRRPSTFIALYAEEVKGKAEVWAMVDEDACETVSWRYRKTFLRLTVGLTVPAELDGQALVTEAYLAEYAFDDEESSRLADQGLDPSRWEMVPETILPAAVVGLLEKVITTVSSLFGQGGEFFVTVASDEGDCDAHGVEIVRRN